MDKSPAPTHPLKDTHKIESGDEWRAPACKVLLVEQLSGYTVCSLYYYKNYKDKQSNGVENYVNDGIH